MLHNLVQQLVVAGHVLAVLSFVVKLIAELLQWLSFANGCGFKQFQHLSGIGTTVANVAVIADIHGVIRMNWAGYFFSFIYAGVALAQEEYHARSCGIVSSIGQGIGSLGCCFQFCFVFF